MGTNIEFNQLTVEIYEGLSTTPRQDPAGDLALATVQSFSKIYPGGMHVSASIHIPRDITMPFMWTGGDRVVIRNGLKIVWEGTLADINYVLGSKAEQGITLDCIGAWGNVLGQYSIDKRWADTRLSDDVWEAATESLATIVRSSSGISIYPHSKEWLAGELTYLEYTMPYGETVKRVTFGYTFDELAQQSPKKVWHFDDSGATYTDLTSTYDDGPSTFSTVTIATDDYIYIDVADGSTYNVINVNMGSVVNANASVMTAEYPTEDATGIISWGALTITDGTASGGATLAIDGNISFTRPPDLTETNINGSRRAWVRLIVSADLTASIRIIEFELRETQDWKLSLYNFTTTTEVVTVTASGTGSVDHALATPSDRVGIRMVSVAKQTPPPNRTVYANIHNPTVYSETGDINLTEIAKDIRASFSSLNSDESQIGSNAYELTPFYTKGQEYITDILNRAAAPGDDSYNAWAVGVVDSEQAATPNGEPVLRVAQVPALDDYDYAVRIDEENLIPPLSVNRDFAGIFNWISIQVEDDAGNASIVTPDGDSTLKDDDSIAAYGERHANLNVGYSSTAGNLGIRFLNEHKDPRWLMSAPLQVVDYIRAKSGNKIPASEIEPGKRVRIENFLADLSGVTDAGLTFLITNTEHSDDGRVCSISAGTPDNLAALMAQITANKGVFQNLDPADVFLFGR